jgi:YesN/AraC family two-component response regulator
MVNHYLTVENTRQIFPMENLRLTQTPVNGNSMPLRTGNLPKILMVENTFTHQSFYADMFAKSYQFKIVNDGIQCLEILDEFAPDIIIADENIPFINGFDLCNIIRTHKHFSHLPFVLLSSKNDLETKIKSMKAMVDAFVSKPLNITFLEAQVQNLLMNRQILKKKFSENQMIEAHQMATNQRDRVFLAKMMKVIEDNIENVDFEVENICKEIGIGRTVLYEKVSNITGKSVGEFIRKTRIKTAAKILLTENVSVCMAMERVGIQSPSYFSKAFKKEFGKTPFQYLQDFSGNKPHSYIADNECFSESHWVA